MKLFILQIFTLCTLFYLVSCKETSSAVIGPVSNSKSINIESTDSLKNSSLVQVLMYRYIGAPLSPDYHRSYSIAVKNNRVELVIVSYHDTLLIDSILIDNVAQKTFLSNIRKLQVKDIVTKENSFCTGGYTELLHLEFDDYPLINGWRHQCGGMEFGNLSGDFNGVVSLFKALIPNLEDKIKSTLKKE